VDPYLGGAWAVCEAVRNIACVGAKVLAITDCLNYGDPEQPEVFWEFSEGVRGIGEACRSLVVAGDGSHGIPVISGNVSFYNQSEKGKPIWPTPIVAAAGRVEDVSACGGFGFKRAGSTLFFLGRLHDRMGGSEYARVFAPDAVLEPPAPDFAEETALVKALVAGVESRAVLSAHDVSHGGLLVTLAEMMVKSLPFEVGCEIDLSGPLSGEPNADLRLFSEFGGIVAEVGDGKAPEFEKVLSRFEAPWFVLGKTVDRPMMNVRWNGRRLDLALAHAERAFRRDSRCRALFA
jgi:phosphoribosylformylglycinamidine synthase